MTNRVYTDLERLRVDTNALIDQGRVRVLRHAGERHPEFSDLERIAVVRRGGTIRPNRTKPNSMGRYVCWGRLYGKGLCRAVFCIEVHGEGDIVVVISVFRE